MIRSFITTAIVVVSLSLILTGWTLIERPVQQDAAAKTLSLAAGDTLRNGDLIFQTSLSQQSKAIQLATRSSWSHCGIIYKEGTKYYVFEAIQPVSLTPLDKWINRGKDHHYVIKRLKNADSVLTDKKVAAMKAAGRQFMGKGYDIYFEWTDANIYCSELIWKVYKQSTGLEVGKLEQLRDFDLSSSAVKAIMKARYGNNIPLDETVISPVSVFNSPLLITVKEGNK